MVETTESGGIIQSTGEGVGGFIAGIAPAIRDFFTGVGQGAGVDGIVDWTALILGIALLLSVYRGLKRGGIVGPVIRGFIAVALLGWAVA